MRVLVVEDQIDVLETVSDLLQDVGLSVVGAASIQVAGALLATEDLDIVLSDMLFPGTLTGLDLVEPAIARGIQFIIMSASADERAQVEARGLRFLPKPFRRAELLAALELAPD
jgi:DNA-binding NtrC family response regulator